MTLSTETRTPKPPRIIIYGPPKMGKSTFGSMAPSPIFIQTEDGLDAIDVQSYPLAHSVKEVLSHIEELATVEHDRKTLVIDSVDWLERLIFEQVCAENKCKSIGDIGYGKGYIFALDIWKQIIAATNWLRDNKDMTIIFIAHSQIKRFENPETESYDRYQIKMHESASAILSENSDIILFVNEFVSVKKGQEGFSQRTRAIGTGERMLYTERRPSFVAGNRFSLPPEIPFDKEGQHWATIASHVPYFNKPPF